MSLFPPYEKKMTLSTKSGLAQIVNTAFQKPWVRTFTGGRRKVSCIFFVLQLNVDCLQPSKDSDLNNQRIQDLTQSDQKAYSHLPENETRSITASPWIQIQYLFVQQQHVKVTFICQRARG